MPLNRPSLAVPLVAAWLGAFSPAGFAEDSPPSRVTDEQTKSVEQAVPDTGPHHEERVEVRAPLPDDEDVAAFVTHLDTTEAAARGEDLADLLRRVPGARVQDYGGLGSYATLSLRGSTSEQVMVFVDGVPQNRALGGAVDLSSVPSTQLGSVSVYRGFAPASFGLGSIGGVVDVRTRDPGDRIDAQVDALAGQLETARLSGSVSLSTGRSGRLRIGGEFLRSEGDFVYLDTGATFFNPDDDVERRRENNTVETGWGLLQQVWDGIGGGQLRLGLRVQDRDRGVPGVDGLSSQTARLEEATQDLTAAWSTEGSGSFRGLDLQLDGSWQEVTFSDLGGEIGISSQDRTTDLNGAGLVGLSRFATGAHRVLVRLELRGESASVVDRALEFQDRGGANRKAVRVSVEDVWSAGKLTVAPSIGWRLRDDDFEPGSAGTIPPPAEDVTESDWVGKVGLAYTIGPNTAVRGSIGSFERSPSLLELFGDRGAVAGNPTLRSERGEAIEAGVQHRWVRPEVDLELVAFARQAVDLIRLVPASQGVAVPRNIGEVEIVGSEASLGVSPGAGFAIQATATYQRATDVTTEPRRMLYQPELFGYLGASWRNRRFKVRWDLTYTGRNATDSLDTPELRMPERYLHDLQLEYRWPSGPMIGIDVRNLFDRQYRDLLRYPLPGRVVLLHFGWRSSPELP